VAVDARVSEREFIVRANINVGVGPEQPLRDPQVAKTTRPTKRTFVVRANINVGLDPDQPLRDPQVAVMARIFERTFVVRTNIKVGLGPEQPLGGPQVAVDARILERARVNVGVAPSRALRVRQSPLCAHLPKLMGGCHVLLLLLSACLMALFPPLAASQSKSFFSFRPPLHSF